MSDNLYDAVAKLNQQPQNTNGADYFNQAKQRQLSKFAQAVQRNNAQVNANPYLPNTVNSLTQYNPNELTQDTVTGDSNWLNTQPNQQNTNILQDLGTSWDMGVNSSSNSVRAKWAELKNGGGDTSRGVYDAYVLANNQAGLPSVSYEEWKAKKEAGNSKTYKELTQQDNQYFKNTQENEQLHNQLSKRYQDSLQNKNEIAKTISDDNQINAIQKYGFGVINNLANPYQAVVNASQSTPTLAGVMLLGSVTGGTGALALTTLSEGLSSENDVYNATMQSKGANFDPNDPNLLEAKSNAFLVGAGSTALGGALAKRVGGADLDNASTFIKKGGNVAGSVIDIAEENAIAYGTSKSIEQATGQKQDHIGSMADATVSTLALNSGMAGFGKGVQGLTSIGAFGFDKTKQTVTDYTTNKTSKQAPVMLDPTSNKYDPVGLYNTAKANESKYKDTDKIKYEQATKIVNDIHNHIQDTIADYDTQIQEATDDVTRDKLLKEKDLFLQNYANEITTRESTQDSLDDSVEQQILNNITKSGADDVIQVHAKNTQDLLEKIYGKVKNNESLTDDDLAVINETIQINRDKLATLTKNKTQTLTDEFHKISDFSREPKKVEALNKRLNLNLHTQDFEQDGIQFQGDFFSYGATDYKQIAKDVKGQPDTLIKDGKFFKQKDGKWFQLLTDDDVNKWTKAYNDELSAYLNNHKSSTTTKPITPHNFTDIKVNKASDIPHKFRIPFANINGKSAHFSGGIIKADTLGFMQLLDNDDEIANLAVGFTSITGGKHKNNSAVSHGTGFKFDLDLKNGDDVQTYKRIGQKVADLAKQHGYDVIVNAEKKGWGSIGKQGDVNFINGGGSHLDIVVKGRLNSGNNQTTQTATPNTTQNSIVKSSWSNQKVWRNLKNNTDFDDVMSKTYSKYGFSLAEQQVLKAQLAQESGLKNLQTNNNWGAGGIAQFIDGTAKKYGINKFDSVQAIDGQARYMKDLLKKYNGDWAKALASYNTGEANVDKHWGTDGTGQGGGVMTMRWNKGNGETLKYVENILAHAGSMTINGRSAPVQNTQTTQNIQTNQAPLNTANVTTDTDTTGADELTSKISELGAQIKSLQDASTKVPQTTTKADTTQSGKPIDVSNDVDIQFNQLVKRYSRIQTDDEIATAQSKLNDLEKAGYDTNKVLALRQLLEAKIAIRGSNIQETQSQVYYGRNGKSSNDTNLGIKQYADVFERAVQTGNTTHIPKYINWLDSFTVSHTQKAKVLNEAFEMNEPVKVANVKGKGWTIMPMDSMFDGSIVGNVYTINENSKNLVEQINKEATALSTFTNAWNQVLTPMLKNKSKSNFDVNQFLPKNPVQEQVIQKEQVTQEPVKTNQQKPVVNNERLKELNHHNQGLDDDKEHYVGMMSGTGAMRSLLNEGSRDEKGSWGNPYGVGINSKLNQESFKHSMNAYNNLLKERLQDDKAIKSLLGLRGKTLTYVKNNDKYPSKQSANLLDYYVNNIPEELVKQNDYKGIKEWINKQSISFNDDGLFEVKQPKKQIQANKKDKKSVDTSNRQQVFTGRDITKDLIKRLDNDLQKQAMDIFDVNDLDELVKAVFDYKNSEIRDSEKDELITYLKDDWQEHISLKPKERSKITSNSKHKKNATNSIGLLGKDESVSFENKQEPSDYETGSHNLSDWFYDTKDTLDDDEYKTIIEVLSKKYPDLTIGFDDSKADIKGGNIQDITAQLVIYSTQKINGLLNEYVQEDNKVDKQMNGLIGSLAFVRNNIKQYLKTKEAKELSKEVKETLKQITQSKDPTLLYNKAIKDNDVQQVLKSIKVENGKVKGNLFSRIIKGITSFLGFKYDTVDNLYEKVLQTAGDTAKLQYNEFGVKVDAKLTALKNANPKDELNKPLKEQDIFRAYVTQSKKPLSSVVNLITELNIQRGKLIQKLGMDKPNKEQSIQLDHFITFNNQFEEHLIDSFGAVSDKKYAYKDLKNYFLNDDKSIDENVLTAMSTAVYDYMIVNGSISKDIKGIGKLLGVSEDDIKNTHISGELIKKYKYIGESNTVVALDIGKSVVTLLGLDINENAPNDLLSKLHASIGAWAISAMQSADLVHINKLNSNEYENDKALVNGKNQQVLEDSKQEISFVSAVTPDGENLNPLIREIQKLNKGTMGYLMNLMGGSSKEKYPSLDKPKKVKTKIKGTNSTVSQKQQDIIDKAQQEAYVVNESMLSVMQSLSELDNSKFMQMVGAKITDATLNKMQISKRESAISKAENMATALQSALDWVDVVPSIDGVRKFYDTMFVAKNDRMHLNSTVFNVQSNKLHRAMADNESFKINLGKVDNKPIWFKDGKITPMGYFIRAVFENAEGTEDYFKNKLKDKYKQGFTVDKVSTQDFNDVAWEYLNTDEVQTAIKAMQAVQNGTGTKDDVAVIYAMVKAWGMEGSSLRALVEASNLFTAIENKTEFVTSLGLGSDGINNGIAIGTYLLGVMDNVFNNMVGLFSKNDTHQDYFSTRLDFKLNDYYEGLKSYLEDSIKSKKQSLEESIDEAKTDKQKNFLEKQLNNLNTIEFLNSTLTGRKTLKAILIPFGYGSGFDSLTRAGSRQMMTDIYERMEKITTDEELDDLNENLSILLDKDIEITHDELLTYEFSKKDEALLQTAYVNLMKGIISDALKAYAPKMIYARKIINGLHSATSQAYISAFIELSNKALKDKQDKLKEQYKELKPTELKAILDFHKLTKKEIDEQVFAPLSKAFPTIKTGYTVGEETTESDIELIQKTTQLDFETGVESVNYMFDGEALAKVTANLGIRIHTFTDTGVTGHSQAVQSSDSVNSSYAMVLQDGTVNQNVHDANIGAIDKQVQMGQAQNKGFYHNLISYHESIETIKATVKTLSQLDTAGLLSKEIADNFINSLSSNPRVQFVITSELLNKNHSTKELLNTIVNDLVLYAKEQETKKLKALQELSVVQQYGTEGGQYTPTQDDYKLIDEQLQKIDSIDLSLDLQSDLGKTYFIQGIHYNTFESFTDLAYQITYFEKDEQSGKYNKEVFNLDEFHQAIDDNPHKVNEYVDILFKEENLKDRLQFPISESKVHSHGISLSNLFMDKLFKENPDVYNERLQSVYDKAQIELALFEGLDIKSDDVALPKSMNEIVNYTGGAYGADTDWDLIGREFGVVNHTHFRASGNVSKRLKENGVEGVYLTKDELEKGRNEVNKLLGTNHTDNTAGNLQGRNYYQVNNADAVYAIASLAKKRGKYVKGGTNTAVALALAMDKPVFVWDISTESWYKFIDKKPVKVDTPVLTTKFAGIGARDIEKYNKPDKGEFTGNNKDFVGQDKRDKALQAIKDVYQKTKETIETNNNSEFVGLDNAVNIYEKLPNKSITGNVTLDKSGAIYSLRSNNKYHFGNPFSSTVKNKGLIETKSVKESVIRYIDWVINSNDDRANWIRQQIQIGKIKNKPIYYYKELYEASHATALDYLINKYNWENNNPEILGFYNNGHHAIKPINKDRLIYGDIFEQDGIPVITTNLQGIHGAGLAKLAKNKGLITQGQGKFKATQKAISFPVKGWEDSTQLVKGATWSESVTGKNIDLVKDSANKLIEYANKIKDQTILLPMVGLGHGEGDFDSIAPIIKNILNSTSNINLILSDDKTNTGTRKGTVRQDNSKDLQEKLLNYLGIIDDTKTNEHKLNATTDLPRYPEVSLNNTHKPIVLSNNPIKPTTNKTNKEYNLESLIESVRKTVEKDNKDQQANIQLLGFVFEAMKQFNYDIKIKMTDLGSYTINGKTYKNQGAYDVSTNILELDSDWFSTASNRDKQTLVAHELLHALTEQSINSPSGKLVVKAVTDLTSMREQLLDVYNDLSDKLDPKLVAKLDLMFDFDENYQLGALGEFVAYGMTDKDIRQFINTHLKTDTKTSIKKGFKDKLDRFLNAVHTMLGLKGKQPFNDFAKSVSQLVGKYETNEQGRLFSKSVDVVAETHKPKNTNEQININQLDNINPKRFSRIQSDDDVVSEVNSMTAIEATKTLKHNVSDEFNKHLDNTIDKVFGKYAYNQTNKKKVLDSIKVKTVQSFAIGLGLSDKESAVYEAHKTILDEFIKTKADTQAVNELYKIREQFIKQFGSAKDLAPIYGTQWDKLDKVSQRQLTNLHKHLLSGTDSVAKIASLVTASYKFNSFMNVDRIKLNQKATGSWFDKLMTIIQDVLDWFNNMTAGNNSKLYTKSVSNITNKLIKIDVASRNKQTGYYDKAWKATGYVGNFASKTLYKGVYLGAKAVGAKEVSQLAKGLSKRYISSDDIAEQLANDIDTTHIPNKYYGEIRNVVNEIAGAGNMRTMVEKLTRLVQSTAQTRQKIKTAVSNTLQQVFDDKPSKEVKSALGRVLVRTDIQSLLETMNSTQAIAMLFNDDKRHAKIVELTDKLLELQDGQAIVNQTKALSAYMVDQVTAPNLVKNAYGIAYGLGRTGQNYDDNVRQVIDTLTTLQAIEYTNNDYINLIKPYKDSPDKLVAVIKQHKAIVDKDKEEFKHNPFNMQKGFGSDLVDPHKSIKYISLEDTKAIQKALAEGWEQVVEELPQDKNDLAPVVAMFYHPSISYTRRVSGALDLADSHSKGTSVYSELDNNDYLNQVIQSRANDLAQIGGYKEFNPYDYSGSLVASYGTDGRVIELHYEMHGFTRDNLLERSHDVFEMLGTMAGTSNFKPLIRESQKQVAKVLKKDFVDNYKINPSLFVLLDPNSSDPKVRDDFRQLPYAMRKELSDEFGMGKPIYIRASAYNGILGYKKYSVKDIWDKAYRINESIEQGFRPTEKLNNIEKFVMLLFKPFGLKSKGLAGQIEELVQHIVGGIKDFIVIRNVRVIIGNILSNSLLLMLHGIDPITMIKGYTKAWTQGQRYNKWQNEYHELESQLAFVKPSEKARINGQMRLLKERMANSSVNVFMQAGMMNTIVEDVTLFKEESDFKSPLEKKINKVTNKIPKEVKTVFDWLMVAPTTPAHKFLADATQFSDFGAKLVLAEHLMKKGMSANKAMSEAQDNFINFDVPTSKGMQYMNDVGLFMFTKFFLRFQRVIVRMFKEKPAQVLAQHYGVEYFTDVAGFLDPFMGFRIGNNPFHASVFSGVGVVDDGVPLFNLVGGF